jgi:hypothetical protein
MRAEAASMRGSLAFSLSPLFMSFLRADAVEKTADEF